MEERETMYEKDAQEILTDLSFRREMCMITTLSGCEKYVPDVT